MDNHQAQAMTAIFGSLVGLKKAAHLGSFNPGAGVEKCDLYPDITRTQRDFKGAAIGHSFKGIFDEIKEDLFDLLPIGLDLWNFAGVFN